jgi:NADP-dependent 3-hydroxy acid dehydrogenase YdfG
MTKSILVAGHGPGISDAVARRFGREGYRVAIVARSAERLERDAKALREAGVDASAFAGDLTDPVAVAALVGRVEGTCGPLAALHWNAYTGAAGDVLACDPSDVRVPFDVAVTGLVAAVQAAQASLVAAKGAVLVTGGGFAFYDPKVDAMATQFGAMGLAISKAAQHKLVGLLSQALAPRGVFVGEVVVTGLVKGTAFDSGYATLDPHDIAAKFWELAERREATSVTFG